jgi:S1-C subfamily serine protease
MSASPPATPATAPDPAAAPGVADLVARVAPAVFGLLGHRHRLGSAVLWEPGVLVATASAVARERRPQVVAADGRQYEGEVAGLDPDTDLAALRVPGLDAGVPAPHGEAPAPRTGDFVFAVAHDAHAGIQASFGRLGAVGGAWRAGRGGAEIEQRLRLDGGLYAGFEGALVADAAGRVLGLATSAFSRTHGLVMPAQTIARVLPALLQQGHVPRPYLGVMVQPARVRLEGADAAETGTLEGALVSSVAEGGPGDAGGLRVGDVLVAAGGEPVAGPEGLHRRLRGIEAGTAIELELVRGGARRRLTLTLGARPAPAAAEGSCCR